MVIIGNKQNKKARNCLPQKKRRQWNAKEKLMVIYYFENNNRNVRGTAKKFNVQPKQICDWIKKKEKLLVTAPHVAKLHPEKSAKYPNLEDSLYAWICKKKDSENAVTRKLITKKAISLSKNQEFLANNPSIIGFKFSNKWLDAFLNRYNLSQRHKTTVAQQLPSDLIEKQHHFLSYIMYLRIEHNYPLKYIGNMNETPLWFDLPSNTTIDHKGAKTVSISIIGHERSSFTVILGCMANGIKLSAVCIYKLKNILKENFSYSIHIRANEKGWVNEKEILW